MKKGRNYKTTSIEKNHRNSELVKKNMLDEIQRKKLRKPFYALQKALSSKTPLSQGTIMSSTNFSLNDLEKVDLNSLYSFSKGTNVPIKLNYKMEISSYIDKPKGTTIEKDYNKPNQDYFDGINFFTPTSRDPKFSFSYFSPIHDLNDIYMENKIIEEKNRLLAYKRNQEEIKEKLKEFGLFKAKYKESSNNKLEMKRLLNMYVNKNNL